MDKLKKIGKIIYILLKFLLQVLSAAIQISFAIAKILVVPVTIMITIAAAFMFPLGGDDDGDDMYPKW